MLPNVVHWRSCLEVVLHAGLAESDIGLNLRKALSCWLSPASRPV